MNARLAGWSTVAVLWLAVSGCGSTTATPTCSPSTCSGCCDPQGECQIGLLSDACGQAGQTCQTCSSTQICSGGFCVGAGGGKRDGGSMDAGASDGGGLDGGTPDSGMDGGGMADGGVTDGGNGGPTDAGCVPMTCAQLGKSCGSLSNGCGMTLQCGTCSRGQTCDANVCVGGGSQIINFDDLTAGSSVTNQYASLGVTFSTAANVQLRTSTSSLGQSPPNFVCTFLSGTISCKQDVYIDFSPPVSNLSFKGIAADNAMSLDVVLFHGAGQMTVVSLNGNGSTSTPTFWDLAAYPNVSRMEIRNVVDSGGVGYDDFAFTR